MAEDRQALREQVLHLRESEGLSWAKIGDRLGFGPGKARTLYKEIRPSGRTVGTAQERIKQSANPTSPSRGTSSSGASRGRMPSNRKMRRAGLHADEHFEFIFSSDQFSDDNIIEFFKMATKVAWVYPNNNFADKAMIVSFEGTSRTHDGELVIAFIDEQGSRRYCRARNIISLR